VPLRRCRALVAPTGPSFGCRAPGALHRPEARAVVGRRPGGAAALLVLHRARASAAAPRCRCCVAGAPHRARGSASGVLRWPEGHAVSAAAPEARAVSPAAPWCLHRALVAPGARGSAAVLPVPPLRPSFGCRVSGRLHRAADALQGPGLGCRALAAPPRPGSHHGPEARLRCRLRPSLRPRFAPRHGCRALVASTAPSFGCRYAGALPRLGSRRARGSRRVCRRAPVEPPRRLCAPRARGLRRARCRCRWAGAAAALLALHRARGAAAPAVGGSTAPRFRAVAAVPLAPRPGAAPRLGRRTWHPPPAPKVRAVAAVVPEVCAALGLLLRA
jgi:hypothetical protein